MGNGQAAAVILLAVYFLPAIVASSRGHMSAGAIFALNLLLGWTALGWIAALVWSLTGNTKANRDRLLRAIDPTIPRPDGIGRWVAPKPRHWR